jgi:hypothetical protein
MRALLVAAARVATVRNGDKHKSSQRLRAHSLLNGVTKVERVMVILMIYKMGLQRFRAHGSNHR